MTSAKDSQIRATEERALARLGGLCAIAGGLLALVGNAVHPRTSTSDIGDAEAFLRLVLDSSIWTSAHVVPILASLMFLAGQVAIYRSLVHRKGGALARLGLAAALVGGTTNLIVLALDGVVMKSVAESWGASAAAEKDAALQAASAIYRVNFGLFGVFTAALFFGVPFILYGLAILSSDTYPPWLGWLPVIGGIGSVIVGLLEAYRGTTRLTFSILFPLFAATLSLWMLAMGILLRRKSSEPRPRPEPPPRSG